MAQILKDTQGATTRQVGDVLTSTLRIQGNTTITEVLQFQTSTEATPQPEPFPTTTTAGTAGWDSDPQGLNFRGAWTFITAFSEITFGPYPTNVGAFVNLELLIDSQNDADWLIEVLDGATVIGTLPASQAAIGDLFGPITSGNHSVRITSLINPAPPPNSNAVVLGIRTEERQQEAINVIDLVPAAPAGTTRTWTAALVFPAFTNAVIIPIANLSGTGNINESFTIAANQGYIFTIQDTVTNVGVYQNQGSFTSNHPTPPSDAGTAIAQAITIEAAPELEAEKYTEPGPYTIGEVITSTLTITNTGTASIGPVPVLDPVPAGVTRTYTAVQTGGATGFTAAGSGAINDNVTVPGGGQIIYTIRDIQNTAGTYQNIANVGGTPIPGPGPSAVNPPVTDPAPPTPESEEARNCRSELVRICHTTDVEKVCDLTNPAVPVEILLVTITSESGDVIPTGSTEFVAPAGQGVFSTMGFYRSYYTDLQGNILAPQPTNVGICPTVTADRELICYVTDANPTPQQAWARHDDNLVGVVAPFVDPAGIAYFTATNPVAPLILAQPGLRFVVCQTDVETEIGCLADAATVDLSDADRCQVTEVILNGEVLDVNLDPDWSVQQFVDAVNAVQPGTLEVVNGSIVGVPGNAFANMQIVCEEVDFEEDFGTGGSNGNRQTVASTNYTFFNTGPGGDGGYTVTTFQDTGLAAFSTRNGTITADSEGDANGNAMFVLANATPGQVYEQPTPVVEGEEYRVSFKVIDTTVGGPGFIRPDIKVQIYDIGTGNILADVDTGPVPWDGVWHEYNTDIVSPSNNIGFRLINNAGGGTGNDFAIDQIEFAKLERQDFVFEQRGEQIPVEIVKVIDAEGTITSLRVFSADGTIEYIMPDDEGRVLSTGKCNVASIDDVEPKEWVTDLCETITTTTQQTQVVAFTGANQRITPPENAVNMRVQAWGAGGGRGSLGVGSSPAGVGGYSEATFPAQTIITVVGQGGNGSLPNGNRASAYGFGGIGGIDAGGSGGGQAEGAGGGGLSGVFIGGVTQANALLIAGGGGGNGGFSASGGGGNGGGLIAENADTANAGKGGTQTAGGAGSTAAVVATNGTAGIALRGGNGGTRGLNDGPGGGGGAGGGYFGGGGGNGHFNGAGAAAADDTAGGGGSGFIAGTGTGGVTTTGVGTVVPNAGNANYAGAAGGVSAAANGAGNNGRVVITWEIVTTTENKFQRCFTSENGQLEDTDLNYDGTPYTVTNEANVEPCCCEEEDNDCSLFKTVAVCFTPTDTDINRSQLYAHYSTDCETGFDTLLGYTRTQSHQLPYVFPDRLDGGGIISEGECPCCDIGLPLVATEAFGIEIGQGLTSGPQVTGGQGGGNPITLTQTRFIDFGLDNCVMPVRYSAVRVSGDSTLTFAANGALIQGGQTGAADRWDITISWDRELDIQLSPQSFQGAGEVFRIEPGTGNDANAYIQGPGAPATYVNGNYTDLSGPSYMRFNNRRSISFSMSSQVDTNAVGVRFLELPTAQDCDCSCGGAATAAAPVVQTSNFTPARQAVTGAGSTLAGRRSVSIINVGNAAGTVQGVPLLPGQEYAVEGYFDNFNNLFVRLVSIPYDATGTTFHILELN